MSSIRQPLTAFLAACLLVACSGEDAPTATGKEQVAIPVDQAVGQEVAGGPVVETIASFPAGTFLENIDRLPGGDLIVTSYFDKKLLRVSEAGDVSTFAQLHDHPVGVVVMDDQIIISVQGTPFSDAPAFTETNGITILDLAGGDKAKAPAANARFLNGLHQLGDGTILVADSVVGALWSVDPTSGALSMWAQDEALAIDPENPVFLPGANGIKTHGGMLYVSNSSQGIIFKRALGSEAAFTSHATTGPVDDFVIAEDGTIYATTHGAGLNVIAPDGSVTVLVSEGCDGCTSVVFSNDGTKLIVANDGNLFEGNPVEAKIFSISIE